MRAGPMMRRAAFSWIPFIERETGLHWRPILGTFGIRTVVCHGEVPKRAKSMTCFKSQTLPLDRAKNCSKWRSFDGVIGQIIELREKDRIFVLLDLLNQRTKVQVDAKSLRAL